MTIRVLLVDDHPLVLQGLRSALEKESELEITAVANTLDAARLALQGPIDVVVCDIRLPDGTGFELLKQSRLYGPKPAFLMLSSFDSIQYVDAAVRLGASGFILKSAPSDTIASAIREIHEGGVRFETPAVRIGSSPPTPALTSRERDLVRALLAGRSNDEIAASLGISHKTVEAHLSKLYIRAGVASRTELAIAAERGGWLDIP